MSRKRRDYKSTFYSRIENFVNGREEFLLYRDTKVSEVQKLESLEAELTEAADLLDKKEAQQRIQDNTEPRDFLRRFHKLYGVVAALVCFTMMVLLLVTVSWLPRFGNADNPANNEVIQRYIEKGEEETGAVNIVTGLILNYRGFDTMGETHVLFIAASCVMILLLIAEGEEKRAGYAFDRYLEPKNDIIIQKVANFLVPVVFVLGIYVILNGHLSPGGGFSGGAIIGAGLIMYVSAFGFRKTERFFNEHVYKVAKVSALCFYVCSLSYYFYMGDHRYNNHIPLGTPGDILSSGLILFINIFVGTEVACTMYAFYALFRKGGLE
jgi:multicomponent Na+:H+ antiporter subunit B